MEEFTERDRRLLSNIHWSPEQRKLLSDKLSLLTDAINAGGLKGADGKSITAIDLTVDGDGKVTGGTATLSDDSTITITVTTG